MGEPDSIVRLNAALEGRYRIERELGEGGMATVYLADDLTHGRRIALKVLRSEYADALSAERFAREIRLMRDIRHPLIMPLLDAGEADGLPYYATPFLPGGSLREKLERHGPLALDAAYRCARDMLEALSAAHALGVLHRDIKPGNLFLQEGRVVVADFGIAKALEDAGTEKLTKTGVVLGTPGYMSPEQATGEASIDARSDVYSVGCVLFELLAGEPPFTGRSSQAIVARQLSQPVPDLRALRSAVPRAVSHVVRKALARSPVDRFSSCDEFARALEEAIEVGSSEVTTTSVRSPLWASTRLRYAGGALIVAVAIGFAVSLVEWSLPPPSAVPDSTRYVVLPSEQDGLIAGSVPIHTLIVDALGQWDEITAVDALVVERITSRISSPGGLTRADLTEVATAVNAGRLVTLHPTAIGDSVRVEARLLDPMSSAEPLRRTVFMVGTDEPAVDDVVPGAVESLLFGLTPIRDRTLVRHTNSVAAARQFLLGEEALADWDLPEAERRLAEAAQLDPFFDLALFWKAQVANWQGRSTREWQLDARRALRSADAFGARERKLAAALVAMADEGYREACSIYEQLSNESPEDFAALFGLGECRRHDPLVVPDAQSRTGWSFRSSAQAAATAYRRAFESFPANFRAFGPWDPELVRRLLYAQRGQYRSGASAPPDSRVFIGFREWRGDSLTYVAVPRDSVALFDADLPAQAEALTRQRRILLDVANGWSRAFPSSSSALHTLALARELVGDQSALGTYREARELATDPRQRAKVGMAEVLLRVRLATPRDTSGLRGAVALGDSILSGWGDGWPPGDADVAGLAVLLGRPALAARMARAAVGGADLAGSIPTEVAREADALLAFAAVGAPADSARSLEERIYRLVDQSVPPSEVRGVLQGVLEQPAFLAFPNTTLRYLDDPELPMGRYARAIALLQSGETERAVRTLGDPFPEAGWDALLSRANVLSEAGRRATALALLQTHLEGLSVADPAEIGTVPRLGALVRALALRAELEAVLGSGEVAAQWARATQMLWQGGEDAVFPVVDRMRSIVRSRDRR